MGSDSQHGPLAGVRVVDLTTVLMGPFASQILGDFGADVIKVEAPGGDGVRGIGPARHEGMAGAFLHANRGKRSVVLDLKQTAGHEALLRLTATADVLLYNVRPQAMARLGLSYEAVAAVNPKILYVGVYGYGQRGPYAARPAYDDLIQGAVAIPTLAVRAGSPDPVYAPDALADRYVAQAAVGAICAGLYHRERSGEGQSIEVPMFETMAQMVLSDHLAGASFVPPLGPTGYARILNPHRRPYRTLDGYVCAMVYNDKQWQAFFALIGRPELMRDDPRFASMASRTEHIHELYAMLAQVLATRTTAQWLELLGQADIPVTPLHTVESLIDDPHLRAVGFLTTQRHPSEGEVVSIGVPSRWSRTQPRAARPAPRLGQHSEEVLAGAGYTEDEIATLVASNVTVLEPR